MSEESFKKYDEDKPRPDLLPARVLLDVSKVLAHGAEKYGDRNWYKCEDPERYVAATLRHLFAHMGGELIDESGNTHLQHALASLLYYTALREHGDFYNVHNNDLAKNNS